MKKKLLIFIIIFLILFSLNNIAMIKEDKNVNENYNLGDMITTSGFILLEENMLANFKIKLVCSNEEKLLMTKIFNVEKNEKHNFEEKLFIPLFYEDKCKLKYEILKNQLIIDEATSNDFILVKDINANISMDKKEIQLGESITLNGRITKLNNQQTKGTALITIEKDGETFLVFNSDINEGILEEKIGPVFIPNGDYDLIVYVRDAYGNEKTIKDIRFNVLTKINLTTEIDDARYFPEETIKISGEINNFKEISNEFTLKVRLNDYKEEKKISNKFKHKLTIPKDTKSNENILTIEILDKYGNKGVEEHKIYIIPIIKEIVLKTNKEEFIPDEDLMINITLLDQAKHVVYDEIKISIKKGFFNIYKEIINSKNLLKYKIDKDLSNKEIKIIANYEKLESEKKIIIMSEQTKEDKQENKGLNYLAGNLVKDIRSNNNIIYALIILFLLLVLIFVFSHSKLRKEITHVFKTKMDKSEKVKKKLQNKIKEKHKEKKELEQTFHKYIDPAIAKKLINDKDNKEGIKKNVTVLFADMRGFTRLAEKGDFEDISENLNIFYKAVNSSIKIYNGIIDQLVGDQVFALFNVTKEDKNHILNAIKAAIKIRQNLKNVNKQLIKKNKKLIKAGIGINSGEVLLSHIGSDNMLRYTAIGNTVNLGARLQGKAKHSQILITQETYKLIKNEIEVEDLGYMNFKNISKQINVFNVIGLK